MLLQLRPAYAKLVQIWSG